MKLTIGIGALNENTKELYKTILHSILGDNVIIKSFNFREHSKFKSEKISVDILLLSTPIMINIVKKYIDKETKLIPIRRTFTRESYEVLDKIPRGIKALLVNNGMDATFETISLLYTLGFDFKLYPYYPGMDKSEDKNIKIAITTNESHLVPIQVKKTYNIGHMVYDMGTILDILNELDLDFKEKEKILYNYQKLVIPAKKGILNMLGENISTKNEMQAILDCINDGIIKIGSGGEILMANKKAVELLSVSDDKLLNSNIENIFGQNFRFSIEDLDNYLINYQEKYFLLNSQDINVFEDNVGKILSLKSITELKRLESQVRNELSVKGHLAKYRFSNLIGISSKLEETKKLAKKIAKSEAPVFIFGETGTGKELFAQAIHHESNRKAYPFLAINCASIPDSLIESELFGYEAGAFTGASQKGKPGLFELSHMGTLFLDEVGDLSSTMQARLLRTIQEGEVIRIGGTKTLKVDVRIISATNRDLRLLAEEKKFRWDLYYRLNVFPLEIPPLRDRKEDIPSLIDYFIRIYKGKKTISLEALEAIKRYSWPGNIRELRNFVQYILVMGNDIIKIEDLPANLKSNIKLEMKKDRSPFIEDFDKKILWILLDKLKNKEKIGRGKLSICLEEAGIYLSEKEVRNRLIDLQDKGLVRIGKGRQGTKITPKGIDILRQ